MDTLIHSSDGKLTSLTPWYLTIAAKARLLKDALGMKKGAIVFIDAFCADYNRRHCYKNPELGVCITYRNVAVDHHYTISIEQLEVIE